MYRSYAVSINIKHISTSSKARKTQSLASAIALAKARFRYQTRSSATSEDDVFCRFNGVTFIGDKTAIKAMAYDALATRSERHTEKNGIRLCDTGHISLPNDATEAEQREIARLLVEGMAAESAALVVASVHHDRRGNKHLHFWAVDGLETKNAAKERNPNAKRCRQRDQLRMNEGGSREIWRERMAQIVNQVAKANGRRRAEHRSLAAQGIERIAQVHEGVEHQNKSDHGFSVSLAAARRAEKNRRIITQNIRLQGGSLGRQMRQIPMRWRRLEGMWDKWKAWLGFSDIRGLPKRPAQHQSSLAKDVRRYPALLCFEQSSASHYNTGLSRRAVRQEQRVSVDVLRGRSPRNRHR